VAEILTQPVITVLPVIPVEEAARIMLAEKISALPVTVEDRLIGLLTETDVVDLFVRALGAGEPSSRLDVTLDEKPGALGEAVRAVEAAGADVTSVVSLRSRRGRREAVIRVATIDPRSAIASLEAAGSAVRGAHRRDDRVC
jgi:acetoin utilization protein AcuB